MKYIKCIGLSILMTFVLVLYFETVGIDGSLFSIIGMAGVFLVMFIWQKLMKKIPDEHDSYPGVYYASGVLTIMVLMTVYFSSI